MKIEKVQYKGAKYTLTIDGIEYKTLMPEILYNYKLKTDLELSNDTLESLLLENEKILATNYILDYLTKTLKTEKLALEKLKQKDFCPEASLHAVNIAKESGLIDDAEYAKNYIKSVEGKKGFNRIKYELRERGVERYIIEELMVVDKAAEVQECVSIATKYLQKMTIDTKTRDKIIRRMLSKGYNFDAVLVAVDTLEITP